MNVVGRQAVSISYKGGYKYQLFRTHWERFNGNPPIPWDQDEEGKIVPTLECGPYLKIKEGGELWIAKGYCWDGPSGPTWDTGTFMRGSLVHDALYQFIRNKLLLEDPWREYADDLLKKICKEDGMSAFRAWYVHKSVRGFGSCAVQHPREAMIAP